MDALLNKLFNSIIITTILFLVNLGLYDGIFLSIFKNISSKEMGDEILKTSYFGIIMIICGVILVLTGGIDYLYGLIYDFPIFLLIGILIITMTIYYIMSKIQSSIIKENFKKMYYLRGFLFGITNVVTFGTFILFSYFKDNEDRNYKRINFSRISNIFTRRLDPDVYLNRTEDDIDEDYYSDEKSESERISMPIISSPVLRKRLQKIKDFETEEILNSPNSPNVKKYNTSKNVYNFGKYYRGQKHKTSKRVYKRRKHIRR